VGAEALWGRLPPLAGVRELEGPGEGVTDSRASRL
jgi:hypothetical protein